MNIDLFYTFCNDLSNVKREENETNGLKTNLFRKGIHTRYKIKMVLTVDARADRIIGYETIEENLNKQILQKIENDLDLDEKISILFLLTKDYTCAFQEIYDLFRKLREQKSYVISEFVDKHPENWKDRLLEAICVLQNRQVIRKLGLEFSVLELLYTPKNKLCTKNFNRIAKCLYMLCEALTETRIKELLRYVINDLSDYEDCMKDVECLELHMLYWVKRKYISINLDDRLDLQNLLKHLKKFDDLELICEDLKKCVNHQNVLDTHNATVVTANQPQTFICNERTHPSINFDEKDLRKINKGLCVIISQMFFIGNTFQTRFGTKIDSLKLVETFKGFGFNVCTFDNLKQDELLKILGNIPEQFGTDYDCIFVCILSHGCKGGIIASDAKEVSIEEIEHKICCVELKDVIKVVIIQACQGNVTGTEIEKKNEETGSPLTTDSPHGPNNVHVSNITRYRNFCIFMSTMQGFMSIRHKARGTWFIQELCDILQSEGENLTFSQLARKIIQSVEKKRGNLDGVDFVAQLPELRPYRLLTDFVFPEFRTSR